MALGSDRLNQRNYLLRDVSSKEAMASPDHSESKLRTAAAESNSLRLDALSSGVGDFSFNNTILAMRPAETENSQAQNMLRGFEINQESMDAVGKDASKQAQALTSTVGSEWGGLIYSDSEGKYHSTPPRTDSLSGNVEPQNSQDLVPSWGKITADYHSHPVPDSQAHFSFNVPSVMRDKSKWEATHGDYGVVIPENPTGNEFSGFDKQNNDAHQRPGYIGTPSGHVRKYTPAADSTEFNVPAGQTTLLK